jgi:uncharacterized protein YgiM (DUF1202 family)
MCLISSQLSAYVTTNKQLQKSIVLVNKDNKTIFYLINLGNKNETMITLWSLNTISMRDP